MIVDDAKNVSKFAGYSADAPAAAAAAAKPAASAAAAPQVRCLFLFVCLFLMFVCFPSRYGILLIIFALVHNVCVRILNVLCFP